MRLTPFQHFSFFPSLNTHLNSSCFSKARISSRAEPQQETSGELGAAVMGSQIPNYRMAVLRRCIFLRTLGLPQWFPLPQMHYFYIILGFQKTAFEVTTLSSLLTQRQEFSTFPLHTPAILLSPSPQHNWKFPQYHPPLN